MTHGQDARASGAALTAAYALMIAANSVWIAHLVRGIPPAVLAFGCLLFATLLFQLAGVVRRRDAFAGRAWAPAHRGPLLRLNVYTAIAWLGLFYAVQSIRPSVNAMIVNALGPLAMVLAWKRLRPEAPPLRQEKVAAAGIFLSMLMLVAASLSRQAPHELALTDGAIVAALAIAALCGALQTATVVTNKTLLESGLGIADVLGNRFLLTIVVAGALAWHESGGVPGAEWQRHLPLMALLAVSFVAVPAIVLQLGLKRTEPVTVTIILFTIPLVTAALELLDPGRGFDLLAFAGVGLGVAAALHGALARLRSQADA
jgi:drug/metabolite transporter (DMT)-like permease